MHYYTNYSSNRLGQAEKKCFFNIPYITVYHCMLQVLSVIVSCRYMLSRVVYNVIQNALWELIIYFYNIDWDTLILYSF